MMLHYDSDQYRVLRDMKWNDKRKKEHYNKNYNMKPKLYGNKV